MDLALCCIRLGDGMLKSMSCQARKLMFANDWPYLLSGRSTLEEVEVEVEVKAYTALYCVTTVKARGRFMFSIALFIYLWGKSFFSARLIGR